MLITKLHIENFGTLSDFDVNFDEDLNEIVKPNGWGKSTLCMFIRVMFYGFLDDRRHNAWKNDRKGNYPFKGGVYGGSIDFEKDGRAYHLERTFGYSGVKEDTFALFDGQTGRKCTDYDENTLGRSLFGIDGCSFENTLFITESGCVSEVTSEIHACMTDAGSEEADLGNYSEVIQKIHQAINERGPRYNGRIRAIDRELQEILLAVAEKGNAEKKFQNQREREEGLKKEILSLEEDQEKIKKKIAAESMENDRKADTAVWNSLKKNAVSAEKKVQEEKTFFPKGIPDAESLEAVLEQSRMFEADRHVLEEMRLSEEEKKYLAENKIIPERRLRRAEEIGRTLERLEKADKDKDFSDSEERACREGGKLFGEPPVPVSAIRDRYALWQKCISRHEALEAKKDSLSEMTKTVISPLVYIGGGLILLGIILFVLKGALGLLPFLAGVAVLLVGGKKSGKNPAYEKRRADIRRDEAFIRKITRETEQFLNQYAVPFEEASALEALSLLLEKRRSYEALLKRKRQGETAETAQRKILEEELRAFREDFKVEEDENRALQFERLQRRNETIEALTKKADIFEQRRKENMRLKDGVTDFLETWNIDSSCDARCIAEILEKRNRVAEREAEWRQAEKELKSFEEMHGNLEHEDFSEKGHLQILQKQADEVVQVIENRKDSLRSLGVEMDETAEFLDQIRKVEITRGLLLKEKAKLEKEIHILTETEKMLEAAKDKFLLKYQNAVRERFDTYVEVITGKKGERYSFDADLNVTFQKDGGTRQFEFLSEGTKDLVALARRLAFVDAMYGEESVFLLMDDPLIALDDRNSVGAKALLKEISKKHQIIYLTCTEARRI